MAHWNGKVTEVTASTHMVLAEEDKDVVKVRKGGKKRLSFSRRALLYSLVSFALAGISYCRALGILVSCFSVAHMMSLPQEGTIAGMSGK